MGPGPHQARALVVEMRQFDLQRALLGRRALAEDVQDQAGAVDDLAAPGALQVALLHRRQRRIDDRDRDPALGDRLALRGHLALAQQRGGPPAAQRQDRGMHHHQPDRRRQPDRLGQPLLGRAARCRLAALVIGAVPGQDTAARAGVARTPFIREAALRRQSPAAGVISRAGAARHPPPWSHRTTGSAHPASRC